MQTDIYNNITPSIATKKNIAIVAPAKNYVFESSQQVARFTIVEQYSLTPCSLALYNRFYKNGPEGSQDVTSSQEKLYTDAEGNLTLEAPPRPEKMGHNFELSKQAKKNLRNKVTWLYHFAKKQSIVTRKGKMLTNFRMNFFTLKLPSEQIHSSDFITKNCLNQLLIEIKKKYNFRNFVWRLEYQNNGNLHYHVATDCYIDYHFLLKSWNRILNKYGYVDLYTRKFSQMSLSEYITSQNYGTKTDYKVLQERYALGCREGWKNPNSVDVKAVFGKSNIAFYISKYMAKKPEEGKVVKLPICEENSSYSRLWFCSRSLSACKTESNFRDAQEIDMYEILVNCDKVKRVVSDYCVVLYFNIDDLPRSVQGVLRTRLELYRQEINYDLVA
jgi:hypothetical protein